MRPKNYLTFFISSLSFLTFGVIEDVKSITENNVNQNVNKCSYDASQYRSLTKFTKNKYCITQNNRVIEFAIYASGNIYKNDMGALDEEEFQENEAENFLQKFSIENDKLVSYRCKIEGLTACEFNRVVIGEKIFFGYKGEKVNGEANGKGTYFWRNGDKFVGEWVDDKRTGKGTFTQSNGDKYVGEWVDDKRTGKGTFTQSNGDIYVGDYVDDKRTGKGTYFWSNGDKYVGEWVDDKRTGKGTLTAENGDKYVGDYVDDKRSGKGTYTWANGDKYVGDWVDDKRTGKGTLTWENGDKYVGDYVDDKRSGKGTLTWVSGDKYKGDWVDGKFDGYGKYSYPDGKIEEGEWSNDEFVKSINLNQSSNKTSTSSDNSELSPPNLNNLEKDIKGMFKKFF
tara:strand:+ start:683 stop:1870 length:1188 start_codon:yes stop_codon:yes gene_type:complete